MRLVKLVVLASVVALIASASAWAWTFDEDDQPPAAVQGTAYSFTFKFNGDADRIKCYLKGGSIPAGTKIEVLNDHCVLDGTPTEYGTFSFDAEAWCPDCVGACPACSPQFTQGSYVLKVLQKLTVATNTLTSRRQHALLGDVDGDRRHSDFTGVVARLRRASARAHALG